MTRRARAGEPEAVEEFLRRARVVRCFLRAKNKQLGGILGPHDLEDAIQETLIALWRKLDRFEGRGSFEAWMYRFSYLELLTRIRKVKQALPSLGDIEVEGPTPTETESLAHESLYRTIDALGFPSADVIRLKHLEDLSFDEIGERLDISPNTAKTRYYRGLRMLRQMLGASVAPTKEDER